MADHRDDARTLLLEVLVRKVSEEQYPSTTILDLIESLLRPDEVAGYVAILMRRIEDERYPSIPMIRRLVALAE